MSKLRLYFHIVWATKRREPKLTPEPEAAVFACAAKLTREMGYTVIAINGMSDHVHLLIETGPKIDLSALMKKVKGVTSAMVNDFSDHQEPFRWQEGYFAATVTPSHLEKVTDYVKRQKERHRDGDIYGAWEDTGEDDSEGIIKGTSRPDGRP